MNMYDAEATAAAVNFPTKMSDLFASFNCCRVKFHVYIINVNVFIFLDFFHFIFRKMVLFA